MICIYNYSNGANLFCCLYMIGFTSVREKIDRFEERQTQQGLERQGPLASVKDQQIREYPNQPESRIQVSVILWGID